MHPDDENELVPSHLYRAVVSIVDAGSMTKAGQLLCLSQAAVSQQISRLEEILGGPVFDKSRRRIEAHRAGRDRAGLCAPLPHHERTASGLCGPASFAASILDRHAQVVEARQAR